MNMVNAKRRRYRALIEAPEILVGPGVYDGFSARLVESMGFEFGFVSGAGISEGALGWPDVGIMGLEDNLSRSRALANCTSIALQADADTGYGNAVNVHFTVKAFEQAGLAGVMIEDQVWPKRCGHMKGKDVISAAEAAQKIRAAADAREDPDFVIMARTDSYATHGMDEVRRRMDLFAEAGADLLFADALLSAEDIELAASHAPKPLTVNMGFGLRKRSTTPLVSARDLQSMGVAVVIYPRLLTAAALKGMQNAIQALIQTNEREEVVERDDLLSSFDEILDLTGAGYVQALEDEYRARD